MTPRLLNKDNLTNEQIKILINAQRILRHVNGYGSISIGDLLEENVERKGAKYFI